MLSDFFFWGHIKYLVYVPPPPTTLVELRERINVALMTIDRRMLQNVWDEVEYRVDVCRVTHGAHIEHCVNCISTDTYDCKRNLYKFHNIKKSTEVHRYLVELYSQDTYNCKRNFTKEKKFHQITVKHHQQVLMMVVRRN
ncbi:hypothetical protein J437_LFUL010779 [Ladona fulva]|uniref:Uncharacterized protein n=1 Tax=Ladona fulva TaxID=123851 RepID=A0A8K0KAL5_LADFU|nr:hypothetical protein J437_LFUL010779 [Ladona fulva]